MEIRAKFWSQADLGAVIHCDLGKEGVLTFDAPHAKQGEGSYHLCGRGVRATSKPHYIKQIVLTSYRGERVCITSVTGNGGILLKSRTQA